MFKLLLVLIVVVVAIAFSALVNCNFKPFETKPKLGTFTQSPKSDSFCCLPNVVSFQVDSSTYFIENNVLKLNHNTTTSVFGDYNRGMLKSNILTTNSKGQLNSLSQLQIVYKGNVIFYEFNEASKSCICRSYDNVLEWYCLKKGGQISNAMIGKYQAKRITFRNENTNTWVYNDNPSQSDKCWLLSSETTYKTGYHQEFYYNQNETISKDEFAIPNFCLSLEVCLNY